MFTTLGSFLAYFIDSAVPQGMNYITLLCYTIAVGILYILILFIIYTFKRDYFGKIKKYIHVSAFNCAVMGTLFTVNGNPDNTHSLGYYILSGLNAGVGFVIAAVILIAAYRKLNSEEVPSSFRGFPAMLIYLGIISMALYSLNN